MTERVLAGRYRLVSVIGQGGMAVVHLAHDELLDRDVAVKVLRPGFDEDPEFIDRFRREARHAASLHHPNIVTIFDTGTDPESNSDYIVMQLVDGPDLQQTLERVGRVSVGFAVRIGIETALALSFAHEHDIIHRDIKPANILIDSDDHVHVADFGIARAATDTGVTTGGMIGSPQYASPEQVVGDPVGPASDLYSLGTVLYEALTGVRPFDGPTPASVALERLRVKPPPIRAIDPSLPRSLEQIVMRLLEQRPEARPSSAAEVAAELDGFRVRELGGVRQQGSRPRGRGAAAVAAAGTLSAAAALPGPEIVSSGRRRRRRGAIPPDLAAALAAMVFLIAGTIGAIVVLGNEDRRGGGILGETSEPGQSAAGALVATPSPTPSATSSPSPSVAPTASPSPVPVVVAPVPTATPTPRPTPVRTAPPTPKPTPRPATNPAPARDPAATVARFYDAVEAHDYDSAAALWSPRMRRQYPPSRYIDGRFDATTRIDVNRIRIEQMSVARREAVVYIDITEHRTSGAARHWYGTWDLVLSGGKWLMDQPHLSGG
jgi:hypothetical protein